MLKTLTRRRFATLAFALATTLALAACGGAGNTAGSSADTAPAAEAETGVDVKVASLKGPTSMGLADLIQKAEAGETNNNYTFEISGSPDEVTPKLISGDVDIALIPANMASVVYNKTEGGISVVDINTLGVLYVVSADDSVSKLEDLAGKTIITTGKGATPEYAMNYLLEQAGIKDQVNFEFKDETAEAVAALLNTENGVAVLPQPFVTAATTKNPDLKVVLSLNDAWNEVAGDTGSQMVTAVTVVRNEFLKEHPSVVADFVAAQGASVDAVNADPETFGQVIADLGIVDAAPIATKAIPECNIVNITGSEMQAALDGYYKVLYNADPASVGGELPIDNFYWLG